MQPPALAPTAQGAFSKTPLSHLLVYALERGLTGSFELALGGTPVATIRTMQGFPAKVRTAEGVHFLGEVMLEIGMISREQYAASIAQLQQSPRLHGQVLVDMGILDPARVDVAVRAQLERKLEHLFSLPADAVFSYFDGFDALQRYGGAPTPIDPFPLLWRGIRRAPSWEHVDGTLRRVGGAPLRVSPAAQLERFQLGRAEAAALELLRQRPMRVVDLANAKIVDPSVAQLLVYCLVICKQMDFVDGASMRPPAQQGRAPQAPASSPGQAFARVQLQAKQVAKSPLVVNEEVSSGAVLSRDGRLATPPPPAQEAAPSSTSCGDPRTGSNPDIGGMIMSTIGASGIPPSMPRAPTASAVPPPPSAPATPAPSSGSLLPAADSAPLTAEHSLLKEKILEKAQQITGQDYFQMLGVDREASPETVQSSFFALAKVWHPDRLPAALVDVKDACNKVFTHLTEAHATLIDPKRREEYMTLLREGGATPDDQAKIQLIIEAATDFQKAEFHLKRNENDKAYELARKAYDADPDQMDYLAMMTWLEAQQPQWLSREKTIEKITVLDKCIKVHPNGERAYFWRGMLFKRIDERSKAMRDLKKAVELNPRNLDAAREVRLFNMRGTTSSQAPGGRPSAKPPASDSLGGLFGKLFKK